METAGVDSPLVVIVHSVLSVLHTGLQISWTGDKTCSGIWNMDRLEYGTDSVANWGWNAVKH